MKWESQDIKCMYNKQQFDQYTYHFIAMNRAREKKKKKEKRRQKHQKCQQYLFLNSEIMADFYILLFIYLYFLIILP